MSRFEERLRERLQDEGFAEGYREMSAELGWRSADEVQEPLDIAKEDLTKRTR